MLCCQSCHCTAREAEAAARLARGTVLLHAAERAGHAALRQGLGKFAAEVKARRNSADDKAARAAAAAAVKAAEDARAAAAAKAAQEQVCYSHQTIISFAL